MTEPTPAPLTRHEPTCSVCKGEGFILGSPPMPCWNCKGTGKLEAVYLAAEVDATLAAKNEEIAILKTKPFDALVQATDECERLRTENARLSSYDDLIIELSAYKHDAKLKLAEVRRRVDEIQAEWRADAKAHFTLNSAAQAAYNNALHNCADALEALKLELL